MNIELFSYQADSTRITIPYKRPLRAHPPGPHSEPEEDIEGNWRKSRAHIKVFPKGGNRPRTLSRASSVATYSGSEDDFEWEDKCDEVDTEEFRRDREEIADWLLCSDPQNWHSSLSIDTMPVPFTPSHVAGSLFLHLLNAILRYFAIIPQQLQYIKTEPFRFREPDYPEQDNAWYYIHPPFGDEANIPITITKNWSYSNIKSQQKSAARIYRVPIDKISDFLTAVYMNDRAYLGNVRQPNDGLDAIYLSRHGHRSKDIGSSGESWHLVCSEAHYHDVKAYLTKRGLWPWREEWRNPSQTTTERCLNVLMIIIIYVIVSLCIFSVLWGGGRLLRRLLKQYPVEIPWALDPARDLKVPILSEKMSGRKPPRCRSCKHPMKGHNKLGLCLSASPEILDDEGDEPSSRTSARSYMSPPPTPPPSSNCPEAESSDLKKSNAAVTPFMRAHRLVRTYTPTIMSEPSFVIPATGYFHRRNPNYVHAPPEFDVPESSGSQTPTVIIGSDGESVALSDRSASRSPTPPATPRANRYTHRNDEVRTRATHHGVETTVMSPHRSYSFFDGGVSFLGGFKWKRAIPEDSISQSTWVASDPKLDGVRFLRTPKQPQGLTVMNSIPLLIFIFVVCIAGTIMGTYITKLL